MLIPSSAGRFASTRYELVNYGNLATALVALPRLIRLIDCEASLRESARRFELDPRRDEEAAEFFGRADRVREDRLALLRRCGLL